MKSAALLVVCLGGCSESTDDTSFQGSVVVNTDTGEITGDFTRAAGTGTIEGIDYESTETSGVFHLAGMTVEEGATVRFEGGRSAIVALASNAIIHGTIDLSGGCSDGTTTCAGAGGGAGGLGGPLSEGYEAHGCGPGAPGYCGGLVTGHTCSGGGGGGAGTAGLDSGAGGQGTGAVPGGSACSSIELLIGGSGGGRGPSYIGSWPSGGSTNAGGGGGGALQLTANGLISISGTIGAIGASGQIGAQFASGGGGGGGGTIVLEAPHIDVMASAALYADGGPGGIAENIVPGGTGGAGLVHLRGTMSGAGIIRPAPTTSAW